MSSFLLSHSAPSNPQSRLENFFLVLFIFFLPSQLGLHFWPEWSQVGNIRVDYLSPILYFTDLLFLPLLIFRHKNTRITPPFPFIVVALVNTLVSIIPWFTIYKWMRVWQLLYLSRTISNLSSTQLKLVKKTLSLAVLWVSVIAILQFATKSSLGGLFYWLGERPLSMTSPAIAKIDLLGFWYGIRSYSVFPHPNALAGFLVLGGLALSAMSKTNSPKISAISNIALLSTASLSGWTAKSLIAQTKIFKTISLFGLITILIVKLPTVLNSASFRLEGLLPLKILPSERLLVGYGLGNSVPALAGLSAIPVSYRTYLQPIHNSLLVLISEVGLITILLLVHKLKLPKLSPEIKAILLVVSITGLLDHYWITSHQNSLLLATLISLFRLK